MALSQIVLEELTALQDYYKRLSKYSRWFLPRALRKILDDLDASPPPSDEKKFQLIKDLCIVLERPDWYGKLVIGWFSGITMFLNATFMSAVRTRVFQNNELTVEDLKLLVEADYSPSITVNAMRFYDSLQAELTTEVVATRKEVLTAISYLLQQSVSALPLPVKGQLIRLAMTHFAPVSLIPAIHMLYQQGYLVVTEVGEVDFTDIEETDSQDMRTGKTILKYIMLQNSPEVFVQALRILKASHALDPHTVPIVANYPEQIKMATLIADMQQANRLSFEILSELVSHQQRLERLSRRNIVVSENQRLDILYCKALEESTNMPMSPAITISGENSHVGIAKSDANDQSLDLALLQKNAEDLIAMIANYGAGLFATVANQPEDKKSAVSEFFAFRVGG